MEIIVTSTQSGAGDQETLDAFLLDTGLEFVPRQGRPLEYLREQNQAQGVVVWEPTGPVLYVKRERFFFHPSMGKNRLMFYRKYGTIDPMIRALNIQPADRVLDCTLGLGADAVVSSYFASAGMVVGLESVAVIAAIVKWGMKTYSTPMTWLQQAIQKITVVAADHNDYLKTLPDDSFDIVYFDPMFRRPLQKSQAISPLRLMADHRPLTLESIEQACRVAKKRVVLKELVQGPEFARLDLKPAPGSANNKIGFGVIEI